MLKKGDKVRIIGSHLVKDFTEAIIVGNSAELCDELDFPILVQFKNGGTYYIENINIFKEDSWIYKLMKLFKRKKYVKYQRTYKECNEV